MFQKIYTEFKFFLSFRPNQMCLFYLTILVLFLIIFFVFAFVFLDGELILKSWRQLWRWISWKVDKIWKRRMRRSILTKKPGSRQVWTISYRDGTVKFATLVIKTRLLDDFLHIYIKRQVACSFLFCSFCGAER